MIDQVRAGGARMKPPKGRPSGRLALRRDYEKAPSAPIERSVVNAQAPALMRASRDNVDAALARRPRGGQPRRDRRQGAGGGPLRVAAPRAVLDGLERAVATA